MENFNFNKEELERTISEHGPKIMAASTVTIQVKLSPSDLLTEASTVYHMESERVTRYTSTQDFTISTEDFKKYFTTLLWLRVSRVNATDNAADTRLYRSMIRNYNVPAFIHILLTSIGRATDHDFGFEFIPTMDTPKKTELLTPEEMIVVSRKLDFLNREGLTCVNTGISMSPLGELATMATFNIETEIKSYRKDSPIYGFYTAFFNHTIVGDIINPNMFRIKYGAQSDFRRFVSSIV